MHRLVLVALLALHLAAPSPVRAEPQTDAVADLLASLQHALQSGQVAEFTASAAPSMTLAQRSWLEALAPAGVVSAVTIRERSRSDASVLADVLIAYGRRGIVASWWIETSPGPTPNRVELRSLTEISRFEGLAKLALDESTQFAVNDVTVTGPDFTATLPSGTAFIAEVNGGTAALVFQGRARIRFTPPDRTEQGQLRIFTGTAAMTIDATELFVRVNSRELYRHVSWSRMQPVPVDTAALNRAKSTFDNRAGLSYHFDLGDLDAERWSLEPSADGVLVDFRTNRHGWLTYARVPEDQEDVALLDRAQRRQISLYASAARGTTDGNFDDDDEVYEVRHSVLDLSFDPARRWFSGRASITLALRRPTPSFRFRLADTFVVSSVSSPELGPLLTLRASGYDALIVGLPANVPIGSAITLHVQYHGRLDPQMLSQEGLNVDADATQEPPPVLEPIFRIEPRFLYSNRSWWYPQATSQRHATASIRLTVPADYHAIATGELMNVVVSEAADSAGGSSSSHVRTVEYRTNRPVRYLSCLISRLESIGRAEARVPTLAGFGENGTQPDRETAVVNVDVMVAPFQTRRLRATPDRVASIVAHYANLIGDAPYPTFTVAALEDRLPGGHSPAYFALLNQPPAAAPLSWSSDPVVFDGVPDFFLAHEIAHQWWGQAVGGRNYHEQWISEGFAQYFAWLYVSSVERPDTGHRVMSRMRATAAGLAAEGPIYLGSRLGHLRGDRRIFRSVVYNKSAVVLHMLRRLVGDDAFFSGVRRLYAASRFRSVGIDDVRGAFQAETSLPLERFFTRWIREAEIPTLRFTWSRSTDGLVVTAQQIGDVFDLPYDITIHYTDGSREQVTLRITEAEAEFPTVTRGAIRRVTFDDELTLVRVVR